MAFRRFALDLDSILDDAADDLALGDILQRLAAVDGAAVHAIKVIALDAYRRRWAAVCAEIATRIH